MVCSMERTLLTSQSESKHGPEAGKEKGRHRCRPFSYRLSNDCLAFRGRRLAHAAAVIDVGDTAAHIHEAAAIVGVGLGAAMLMGSKAGTGRDQATHDDVFLQAAQVVLEATHRRFREDAGGFLERRR